MSLESSMPLILGAILWLVIMYFVIKTAVKDAVHSELKMINKNLTLIQEAGKKL